ncbi:hypothetical protein HanHA300_Chr06g0197871 [Helianthus annuus]|nr:hypothetical protein HanHA300_Chr06g0197871 [Helianthus annuus]KAJ0736622.1 hypothetical protein HanLR1_Chr06g0197931 [Helianthus annuus]KAJ0739562.1 hypothetical protein HanOQP8_Chr06g0207111 [Helianthus annuus]
MENKQLFMSALSVGLGVGVGMTVSRWTSGGDDSSGMRLTPQTMEREMLSMIVDGKDSKATFDQFPYYLRYIYLILFYTIVVSSLLILIQIIKKLTNQKMNF